MASRIAATITDGLSRLTTSIPFTRSTHEIDNDDNGETVVPGTIAGGGHAARDTELKHNLRCSRALKAFIRDRAIIDPSIVNLETEEPTPQLRELIERPHILVPAELNHRGHPLQDYFISSSHNTYLLANQLYGSSCATAYETALRAGARCVEIDAWDNPDDPEEPKVTHGWTLTSNIPFRAVCEAIRDVHDEEEKEAAKQGDQAGWNAAPMLLSLENHCGPDGQRRLVDIMQAVFGDRLLSEEVRKEGHAEQAGEGEPVRLNELGSKIAVIVEYEWPDAGGDDTASIKSSGSDSEDEDEKAARKVYNRRKVLAAPSAKIIPSLSALGVYAQSVKPRDHSWFQSTSSFLAPKHHLLNISESGLATHLPKHSPHITAHNSGHLMRVYPKGTRITSRNLKPVPFWGVGAQICALNWQTFGAAMQCNEALFAGTDGYVLKPKGLRLGQDGKTRSGKEKLKLHVAGATDVPVPESRQADDLQPYFTCTLVHPNDVQGGKPLKCKTKPYRQQKSAGSNDKNPPTDDPLWDEVLEWEYDANELVFLRMLVKSDDKWAANPILAVGAVRLEYARNGEWVFVRMMDLKGRETKCNVLLRFEIEHVPE